MQFLNVRNGLGELFNSLFLCRTMKTVVQVRTVRQDKPDEDHSLTRGVSVVLRSIQFQGIHDIEGKLRDFERQGIL
jgi:hypothetical protein